MAYPVHPGDPVRKIKMHFVNFLLKSDWTLATKGWCIYSETPLYNALRSCYT